MLTTSTFVCIISVSSKRRWITNRLVMAFFLEDDNWSSSFAIDIMKFNSGMFAKVAYEKSFSDNDIGVTTFS